MLYRRFGPFSHSTYLMFHGQSQSHWWKQYRCWELYDWNACDRDGWESGPMSCLRVTVWRMGPGPPPFPEAGPLSLPVTGTDRWSTVQNRGPTTWNRVLGIIPQRLSVPLKTNFWCINKVTTVHSCVGFPNPKCCGRDDWYLVQVLG